MPDRSSLQLTPLPGLPLVQPGDDLAEMILAALARRAIRLSDGDILVLAQKIVSKAEGRLVDLDSVTPSSQAARIGGSDRQRPSPGRADPDARAGRCCAPARA